MKRLLIALVLLSLLLALSLWDLRRIDALTESLCACIELSVRCMEEGDTAASRSAAESAVILWEKAEGYSHIFLRHSEVDSLTDSIYQFKSAVYAENTAELPILAECTETLLHSLRNMEHPRMGSVF